MLYYQYYQFAIKKRTVLVSLTTIHSYNNVGVKNNYAKPTKKISTKIMIQNIEVGTHSLKSHPRLL